MRALRHLAWLPAALIAAMLLAVGCRSGGVAAPVLRIGVAADSPPLIFKQRGRWAGVEADLGRALAARLGLKPVFIPAPPDRLPEALLTGQVDLLMAGMAITQDRRIQLDFSSPYLVVGQAALVRSNDLLRFNTELKIRTATARFGVVAGSAADPLVANYFTAGRRITFPDADQALAALREGAIDAFLHDAPAAWWLALQHPGQLAVAPPLFAKQEIAWAFRRGSVSLREAANAALADWQQDGTLETTLRRWLPVSP